MVLWILLALSGCAAEPPEPGATTPAEVQTTDILIENVRGYTWRNDAISSFSALRFDASGQIVATYSESPPAPAGLRRIDARGATLLPGLIDAHAHVEGLGHLRNRVDLMGSRSLHEALERIRTFASANPDAEWILGRGWNQVLWTDNTFPTAADLDALQIGRPIWLNRVDGHAGWANTLALEAAGIDQQTPDPHGGKVLRDAAGEATGIFIDKAEALVEAVIPEPTRAERRAALLAALAELARLGITSVHDAGIDPEVASLYRQLAGEGAMPVRVYAMLNQDSWKRFGDPLLNDDAGFIAIRSIKAYLDGALGSRGAALLAPYSDEPPNTGLLFAATDAFTKLAREAADAGYQVNVHAIGDAANRVALDGFAALDSRQRLRHRVEHAQIIAPADLPRFAALAVIASMQPIHATSDMNMAGDRLGEERLSGGYAWRTLLDSGAVIASGSDFPVEPANPFFGLHAAVSRQDREGEPPGGWYPDQVMTRAEALRTFTHDAAYAAHQEKWLGTLEPGKKADFILVDRDFFEVPVDDIWQTVVLATWVNGVQVYEHR